MGQDPIFLYILYNSVINFAFQTNNWCYTTYPLHFDHTLVHSFTHILGNITTTFIMINSEKFSVLKFKYIINIKKGRISVYRCDSTLEYNCFFLNA